MQKATICGLEPACAVYRLPTDTNSSRDSHFMGCEVQAKTKAQDIHGIPIYTIPLQVD